MAGRPRIALFAPYFPEPAFSGGRIRIHHFAHALAEHAELHLFAQASAREAGEPEARSAAMSAYSTVATVPAGPTPPWPLPLPLTRSLSLPSLFSSSRTGRPARVRRGSPRRLARLFAQSHARAAFDAIVVEHCHAAAIARESGLPWLLDEHNIESEYVAAKLRAAGELRCWQRAELRGLRAWEAACWREATEVVAVTDYDAQRISGARSRAAQHIPNGVTEELAFTPPSARRGEQVLFVGLMDHAPNVHAARVLAKQIMPQVWATQPSAALVLCGANPAREVRELAGPRIVVTGRVPSIAPYLTEARVFANALEGGAGSSLKVLEALATGLPLISTSAGVRGFAVAPEAHYLAAATPSEFAAAITRCLNDAEPTDAADRRAQAGREFTASHSWRTLAARFTALALSVAARGKPAPAEGVRS